MIGTSGSLVLDLTCTLDASPERIFDALTDPARLATWWGPSGFTTTDVEIDLRIGGSYSLAMQPPGGEVFHLAGEFLEVEPPTRLAYSFRWTEPDPDDTATVVEVSLEAGTGPTRLSVRQGSFATEARLELHRKAWTDALQKLSELIKRGV